MNFNELMKLADELRQPAPQQEKPRMRVYAILGNEVVEAPVSEEPAVEAPRTRIVWPTATVAQHAAGSSCPHCRGTGRYRFHTDRQRNEKCFRCDGKGRLDSRDIQFLQARIGGRGPVCEITSA